MCASRVFNKRKHVLAKALLQKAALVDWSAPGLRKYAFPDPCVGPNGLFSCCDIYYHLAQYWTCLFLVTMNKCTELRKYAFPDSCLLDFFFVLVDTITFQNIRHFFNTLYNRYVKTSCLKLWKHSCMAIYVNVNVCCCRNWSVLLTIVFLNVTSIYWIEFEGSRDGRAAMHCDLDRSIALTSVWRMDKITVVVGR